LSPSGDKKVTTHFIHLKWVVTSSKRVQSLFNYPFWRNIFTSDPVLFTACGWFILLGSVSLYSPGKFPLSGSADCLPFSGRHARHCMSFLLKSSTSSPSYIRRLILTYISKPPTFPP
jgi:hypothetical protein